MNYTKSERPFSLDHPHMSTKDHIDEEDVMADPDYTKFLKSAKAVKDCCILENVTVVRSYYELHLAKKVRGVEKITYEVEELSSDKLRCKVPEVLKSGSLGGYVKSRRGYNQDEAYHTSSLMNGLKKRKRFLPDEEVEEEVTTIPFVEKGVDSRYIEGFGVGNCYKSKLPSHPKPINEIKESLSAGVIRFQGSGPNVCRKSADCGRRGILKAPSSIQGESEFCFMDRSYKTLLDLVEVVGESLVLKTNSGEVVEYEKRSSIDSFDRMGSDSCKRKSPMSHQQRKNIVTDLHHVLGRSSTKRRKVHGEGQSYRSKLRSNILKNEGLLSARKEKENISRHITNRTSEFSVQELNLVVNRSSLPKSQRMNHVACKTVEQDFKLFLDGAILRDGFLVYKRDDGKEIVVEEDSDSSSIIVSDNAAAVTDGKSNPFVITRPHYSLKSSKQNSDFRRMLIKTLRKPYDYREHKKLLREASKRTPVVYHRELRSRTKDYPVVEVLGKSYFEHHRGLEDRFNSVRNDRRKGLNLLRGFFYWLENLNQEGSFKPWTDKVCLQVMPRE